MITRHFSYMTLSFLCMLTVINGCARTSGTQQQLQDQTTQVQTSTDQVEESQSDKVSVWAGSMIPGAADGPNDQAQFIKPYGLCGSQDGGILVVDCYANLLRLSSAGKVVTVAGNADTLDQSGYPMGGYINGSDTAALLNRPRFAAVSKEGAVIFSDTGNHRVRILLDGSVRMVAGGGVPGFRDGDYSSAEFNTPSGVAIGSDGTIYVADTLNHCIRSISPEGQVTTMAGKPQQAGMKDGAMSEALFCEPNDIELGTDGALYVVDKGNQRIRRIADEQVTTIAGSGEARDLATDYIIGGYHDGPADQSLFQYPTGLCLADDGTIYVADTGNNCIRMISPDRQVSTLAGTKMPGNVSGSAQKARFNQPLDVYEQDGRLYISDSYNHAVRVMIMTDSQKGEDGL